MASTKFSPIITNILPNFALSLGSRNLRRCLSQSHLRHSVHATLKASSNSHANKNVKLSSIRNLYKKGEPILAITAHDFPSGLVADSAGIEMILVGDSLAMIAMGMEDTSEVTLDEMIMHCRSVSRAVKSSFTV